MLDVSKLFTYYPKDLIEKMKKNYLKEYTLMKKNKGDYIIDRRSRIESVTTFKDLMQNLTGSQLPHKIELQLEILEDIIMEFMIPYTRQLLLERISKKIEESG